ncbi:MAG: CatA-like O-acetyltransferase [Dysosmobacter welbionis]
MAFTPIDEQTWERREYLEVFRQTAIYLTAEVDITPLYRHTKARGEKLYPALVWCVAAVLNRHAHFRYGRDEAGRIGIWDELHPYYTVPAGTPGSVRHEGHPLYTGLRCVPLRFREDYARAETCGRLLCDETLPQMSAVSPPCRAGLLAFSFGGDPKPDFTPFVLLGRSTRQGTGRCCR